MIEYWAVTDSQGDTPDEPIVVLRSDGPLVSVWAKHLKKWMPAPSYIESIYGDDHDAVPISEQQAAEYRGNDIGMDKTEFEALMRWQDTYAKMTAAPAQG